MADGLVPRPTAREETFLSVVLSFRNEESTLEALLAELRQALDPLGVRCEFVFVNDASTDRSLEILLRQRETDARVKIVNMSRRFGFYPCIMAGLASARGNAVVYMCTDLQDPPDLIPRMLEAFWDGAEVVNTVRTKRLGESAFKMWVTRKAYQVINLLSDIDLPENMGDFKLLSRRVVDTLLRLPENDPYLRGIIRWVGFRQDSIPYQRLPRHSGRTHFPLLSAAPVQEFIRGVTSFSVAPLLLCLIYGLVVSLISLSWIGVIVVTKLMGINPPGFSAIMAATLFLNGNLLLTNGLIGLYIARIYNQVKDRPRYIIQGTVGLDDKDS